MGWPGRGPLGRPLPGTVPGMGPRFPVGMDRPSGGLGCPGAPGVMVDQEPQGEQPEAAAQVAADVLPAADRQAQGAKRVVVIRQGAAARGCCGAGGAGAAAGSCRGHWGSRFCRDRCMWCRTRDGGAVGFAAGAAEGCGAATGATGAGLGAAGGAVAVVGAAVGAGLQCAYPTGA